MDKITVDQAVKLLTPDNPRCPAGEIRMYAEAWVVHREATANVEKNGAIVAHPRTGSPLENPYFAVVTSQMKIMLSLKRVARSDALWLLC